MSTQPKTSLSMPRVKPLLNVTESVLRHLLRHDLLTAEAFYVLNGCSIGMDADSDLLGCHAKNLDLASIEFLGDRWHGRGPAIALNFPAIFDLAKQCSIVNSRQAVKATFKLMLLAIGIHETAHAVVMGLHREPLPPITAHRVIAMHDHLKSTIKNDRTQPVDRDTWQPAHDARFIRVLLHLFERATEHPAGHFLFLHPDWLFHGPGFGLSHITSYLTALGDEPERLIESPLQSILDCPAPAAFLELYDHDQARRLSQLNGDKQNVA